MNLNSKSNLNCVYFSTNYSVARSNGCLINHKKLNWKYYVTHRKFLINRKLCDFLL